jgi:hypothetical protein
MKESRHIPIGTGYRNRTGTVFRYRVFDQIEIFIGERWKSVGKRAFSTGTVLCRRLPVLNADDTGNKKRRERKF